MKTNVKTGRANLIAPLETITLCTGQLFLFFPSITSTKEGYNRSAGISTHTQ